MCDGEKHGASLPARRFQWNPRTARRLAERLLEGNSLQRAIELLGIEFGKVSQKEGVAVVLAAGGIGPFILREVPDVTRLDVERMQENYRASGGKNKKPSQSPWSDKSKKARSRGLVAKLAGEEVFDQNVEAWLEILIESVDKKKKCMLTGVALLRGKTLALKLGVLVETLTVRIQVPYGVKVTSKDREFAWLCVARLTKEGGALQDPDSRLRSAFVKAGVRRLIVQVIDTGAKQNSKLFEAFASDILELQLSPPSPS